MGDIVRLWFCTLIASMLLTQGLSSDLIQLQHAREPVPTVSVRALTSSSCPQRVVWVFVKIVEQTGDDTYIIEDRTGQITLFLPTDELMNLAMAPGMEVLISGRVDISPVHPSKNELYAETIQLAPTPK